MKFMTVFLATFLFINLLHSQTMRYFELVGQNLPTEEWRDSAYVVAASDSALLAEIAYELSLPLEQRRHVNGPIAAGDGGFNRNSDFRFDWHTQPNQWAFADFSVEVCDGRAYSDVNSDTAYWIGVLGYFCGWSYRVVREISAPVSIPEPGAPMGDFRPIVPNPANDEVLFSWSQVAHIEVVLHVTDVLGRFSVTLPLGRKEPGEHSKSFATSALSSGEYVATLQIGKTVLAQRFVIVH